MNMITKLRHSLCIAGNTDEFLLKSVRGISEEKILNRGVLHMTSYQHELMDKRCNAVAGLIMRGNLSPWAKKYWKTVFKILHRRRQQAMASCTQQTTIYAHTPPFDTVK